MKDENGQTKGAKVQDTITKKTWEIEAKAVINATGCFCDSIRYEDGGKIFYQNENKNAPSQGQGIFRHGAIIASREAVPLLLPPREKKKNRNAYDTTV